MSLGWRFLAANNDDWLQWTNFYGKLPVRIIWQGTDITGTTSNKVTVGQLVSLQAVPDPSLPATSNFTWSVQGTAISNYVVGTGYSTAQVLPLTQTNSPTINFYWVSGGLLNVSCTMLLTNGMTATGTATFNVQSPNPRIMTTTGSVTADSNYFYTNSAAPQYLHFGNTSQPGIVFNLAGSSTFYGGTTTWAQVILASYRWRKFSNATCQALSTTNSLDTQYPYSAFSDQAYDDPGVPLYTNSVQAVAQDSYQMWLLYTPPGTNSIPVPLRTVAWNWSGDATPTSSNGVWNLVTPYGLVFTNNPSDAATTNYPTWTGITSQSTLWPSSACP